MTTFYSGGAQGVTTSKPPPLKTEGWGTREVHVAPRFSAALVPPRDGANLFADVKCGGAGHKRRANGGVMQTQHGADRECADAAELNQVSQGFLGDCHRGSFNCRCARGAARREPKTRGRNLRLRRRVRAVKERGCTPSARQRAAFPCGRWCRARGCRTPPHTSRPQARNASANFTRGGCVSGGPPSSADGHAGLRSAAFAPGVFLRAGLRRAFARGDFGFALRFGRVGAVEAGSFGFCGKVIDELI